MTDWPEDQDRIDARASQWVVRRSVDSLSPDEEREFEAWRAGDARHDRELGSMQRTWDEIGELGDLAALAPAPAALSPRAKGLYSASPLRRRGIMIGATGAAAAVAACFLVPGLLPAPERRYETRVAETRQISLADGSTVTLGAHSAMLVKFTGAERRVVLTGGEAFFDIVHDGARPFLVEAGTSLVRDVGTKFDVKLGVGAVHVSVLEGVVQVGSIGGSRQAGASRARLHAGQRAEIAAMAMPSSGQLGASPKIVALPAQGTGAWREGRLVYEDVKLADLVADVNRYYAPGVRLGSATAGDLRVTASFRTGEIPAFMSALDATLPVKVGEARNGSFRIDSPAN